MKISIPELSLILLVGPSGSGKSLFGRKHFLPTEVVSSDFCRALVSDNENDQAATADAFDLLHGIVRKRLARGHLTVVDAINVHPEARKSLIALAKEFHLFAEAIVFDLSERVCQDRNVLRPDRQFGPHVIRNQSQQLRRSLRGLEHEGIRHVFKLSSPEEVDAITIERHPLWNYKKAEHGPFDIIGDVHGCFDELVELLAQLGYSVNQTDGVYWVSSSGERKLVFVGDLVDRGPGTVQVLRLVSSMVQSGQAFCVPGNHDMKIVRALRGRDVKRTHGLAETMEQLGNKSNEFRVEIAKFLDGLVSHYAFDDGKLVVAHAGLKESMHVADQERCESSPCLARQQEKRMNLVCRFATTEGRTIAAHHQEWCKASVNLVAPSTFVMRFRLYAIVTSPISTRAPDNPRIRKRGCPKIRYLIVAKGCSTVARRSLIAFGVTLFCIRFNASSYRCRAKSRNLRCRSLASIALRLLRQDGPATIHATY